MHYGFSTLNHYNCKRCVEPSEHLKKCKRCVEPFHIATQNSTAENGVLTIDLSQLGFTMEVEELVASTASAWNVVNGEVRIEIAELHPNETLVYKISP